MATKKNDPVWSLVFWMVPTIGLVGFGVWCIFDGWFNPACKSPTFNKIMTPIAFAAAVWCLREGIREYRKVKQRAEAEGEQPGAREGAAGSPEGPAAPAGGEQEPGRDSPEKPQT